VDVALPVDEDRLAGGDVLDLAEIHDVERNAFRADGVGRDDAVAPHAPDERLDPEGIAEGDQALLGDIGHDRITADDFAVHALHCLEDMLRPQLADVLFCQLLGKDVEDALDIVVRVEEAVVFLEKELLELGVVHHVSVMGHDDAEGRVDLEGLGVFAAVTADRRVAGVADADLSLEALGVFDREDVADQTVAFFGVEAAVISDDAGRVLAAVLHGEQSLVEVAEDFAGAVES